MFRVNVPLKADWQLYATMPPGSTGISLILLPKFFLNLATIKIHTAYFFNVNFICAKNIKLDRTYEPSGQDIRRRREILRRCIRIKILWEGMSRIRIRIRMSRIVETWWQHGSAFLEEEEAVSCSHPYVYCNYVMSRDFLREFAYLVQLRFEIGTVLM
jgi:hypothetical protein